MILEDYIDEIYNILLYKETLNAGETPNLARIKKLNNKVNKKKSNA